MLIEDKFGMVRYIKSKHGFHFQKDGNFWVCYGVNTMHAIGCDMENAFLRWLTLWGTNKQLEYFCTPKDGSYILKTHKWRSHNV